MLSACLRLFLKSKNDPFPAKTSLLHSLEGTTRLQFLKIWKRNSILDLKQKFWLINYIVLIV